MKNKNKLSRGLRLGLLTALATCGIGAVNADQICYTNTFPSTDTVWSTTVSVPRFDPVNGTLTSVEIHLESNVAGSATNITNGDPSNSHDIVSTLKADVEVWNEANTALLLTVSPQDSRTNTFLPLQARTYDPMGGSATNQSVSTDTNDLAAFTGLVPIVLPIVASSSSSATGGPTIEGVFHTHADATVIICYNYTPPTSGCVHSLCYWKSHCSTWPVDSLTIGCKLFTKLELLKILSDESSCGNRTLLLAQQLIVAELNIAGGADGSCIREEIAIAEALLCSYKSPGCNKLVPNTSWDSVGCTGVLKDLKDFNTGLLCTPTCDETKPHDSCPPKKDGCDKDKDKDKSGCDKDKDKSGCDKDKDKDKSGDKSGDKSCKKS